jgi:hypothetical protein
MLKTNISQKVAVVALFVVLTFAVAGLTAVTFLSESFVVAQGLRPGNFTSVPGLNGTRPIHGYDSISVCFKTVGDTEVGTSDIQNWTESIQNFISLIPTDNTLTLINNNIVRGSGPITDMAGIWDMLKDESMTAYDRNVILTEVNSLLAAAQPGFTQIQQDALSKCITNETNSLGRTPNY